MEHGMHDMGEVRDTPEAVTPGESESKEKHYPSVSFSSKQIPQLKGKKFGEKVELHICGKVGGIREDYGNKSEAEYEIKIMQCGMKGKISEEEYKKLDKEGQDKEDEKEVLGDE